MVIAGSKFGSYETNFQTVTKTAKPDGLAINLAQDKYSSGFSSRTETFIVQNTEASDIVGRSGGFVTCQANVINKGIKDKLVRGNKKFVDRFTRPCLIL